MKPLIKTLYKNSKLFLALLILLPAMLHCQSLGAKNNESAETTVLALLKAFENHDLKTLEELYSEKAVSFWSLGIQVVGKKQHLDEYAIGFKNHEKFKTQWERISLVEKNDMAYVVGKVSWFSAKKVSDKPDYILKSTFILVKENSKWRIIHEHSSQESLF